jgi:uncharacterized membrane protein YphA (DoxX/SURF4 family)
MNQANINGYLDRYKEYGPVIVRIGLSLVFFWFAISQLMAPSDWTGYLPNFLYNTPNPVIFIYANIAFELIFASLLILGIWTRISALLLGLHLIGISITLGWNAIAIRDYGLALATLSIVLSGPDRLCLKK